MLNGIFRYERWKGETIQEIIIVEVSNKCKPGLESLIHPATEDEIEDVMYKIRMDTLNQLEIEITTAKHFI